MPNKLKKFTLKSSQTKADTTDGINQLNISQIPIILSTISYQTLYLYTISRDR